MKRFLICAVLVVLGSILLTSCTTVPRDNTTVPRDNTTSTSHTYSK